MNETLRFAISDWRNAIVDSQSAIVNTRYYTDHRGMNEMKKFGQLLKDGRARKGITADALASAAGIGPSVLSEIETGKRASAPDASWVRSFSEALDIPRAKMLVALGYLDESDLGDCGDTPAVAAARDILGSRNYTDSQLQKFEQFLATLVEIVDTVEG